MNERPAATGGGRLAWRTIGLAALAGFAISLVFVLATVRATEAPPVEAGAHGYVVHFAPPRTGFETLLLRGDGQAYATVTLDPTLRRPSDWGEGAPQEAFFAQRPLFSYTAWVLSGGNPDWLPGAFIGLSALAGALLAGATAAALQARDRGQDTRLAPVVLAMPNVLVALISFGPDVLAAGWSLTGLALWQSGPTRPSKRWLAVAAFGLAVLARESAIIVPVVVVAYEVVHRRFRPADLLLVVVPGAAYVAWLAFVRHQLDSGPEKVARATSFAAPFRGLVDGSSHWVAADVVFVVLLFGFLAITVARWWRQVEAWIIAAYVLGATVLNGAVWQSWLDVGRVMVPGVALAWTLWVPRSASRPVVSRRRFAVQGDAP